MDIDIAGDRKEQFVVLRKHGNLFLEKRLDANGQVTGYKVTWGQKGMSPAQRLVCTVV